jgi:glycosyltransferase involved in cell wall biosynthesis
MIEPSFAPIGARHRESGARIEPGLLSVVIPCYNETAVLPLLEQRLRSALDMVGMSWEVIFVDDGSTDGSYQQLALVNTADSRFKVLRLSRNFGHQAAIAAGLCWVRGEVVAILDADLQDPPELIGTCLDHWRQGDQVVYCQRERRQEGVVMRFLYGAFYRLFRSFSDVSMPLDAGDFCLMDRRVVDVIAAMPEHRVFVRGLRAWAGFRQRALPYDRPPRAAGESKYRLGKLLALAGDGLFSFTLIPLRLATWLGLLLTVAGSAWGVFVLAWRLLGFQVLGHTASDLPGWAGFVLLLILFGSVQLILLGVLGEYVGRIYEETKGRPRWVIESMHGFGDRAASDGAPPGLPAR